MARLNHLGGDGLAGRGPGQLPDLPQPRVALLDLFPLGVAVADPVRVTPKDFVLFHQDTQLRNLWGAVAPYRLMGMMMLK